MKARPPRTSARDSAARSSRVRPGGRSASVREAVRRATRELLVEEGFAGISLPAVAQRAGVNKTTVYRWWSSPVELLHEALGDLGDLALPDVDTGSWEGDVEAFVQARLQLVRNHTAAGILRAAIALPVRDPTLAKWVEAFWKPRRRQWRSPIERAIGRGELSASARDVPLLELVAGPLLLAHLVTHRRLTRAEVSTLAATIAAGVRALHGRKSPAARDYSKR